MTGPHPAIPAACTFCPTSITPDVAREVVLFSFQNLCIKCWYKIADYGDLHFTGGWATLIQAANCFGILPWEMNYINVSYCYLSPCEPWFISALLSFSFLQPTQGGNYIRRQQTSIADVVLSRAFNFNVSSLKQSEEDAGVWRRRWKQVVCTKCSSWKLDFFLKCLEFKGRFLDKIAVALIFYVFLKPSALGIMLLHEKSQLFSNTYTHASSPHACREVANVTLWLCFSDSVIVKAISCDLRGLAHHFCTFKVESQVVWGNRFSWAPQYSPIPSCSSSRKKY